MVAKETAGVRLDLSTIERIDRIAAEMSRRAGGIEVSRATALRAVVDRGVPALEAELGIAAEPSPAPARKGGKTPARKP